MYKFPYFFRGVVADSEETIKKSAESLGKDGFINYFGLQVLCLLVLVANMASLKNSVKLY